MSEQVQAIRAEIVRLRNEHEKAARACSGLNIIAMTHGGAQKVCDEILAFIDSQPNDQPIDGNKTIEPSKDLEEAAWKYAEQEIKTWDDTEPNERKEIHDDFIAGAKWQAEHTEDFPMPEDTVLFNKGVEEGKRLMGEDEK